MTPASACAEVKSSSFVFFLGLLINLSGQGQALAAESCDTIVPTPEEKLVLSRLISSKMDDDDRRRADDYARLALEGIASNLTGSPPSPKVIIAPCHERSRKIDVTDFDPPEVELLTDRHVLLEVWGNLVVKSSKKQIHAVPDKKMSAEGAIAYFMVASPHSIAWTAPDHFIHEYHGTVPLDILFKKIFAEDGHFEVLTATAIGVVESKNHRYVQAHTAFCHARSLLRHDPGQGSIWRQFHLNTTELASSIEKLARENFDKAPKVFRDAVGPGQASDGGVCPIS